MAGLNCTSQYRIIKTLIRNRKGKASPKKAGNQKRTGEMYFAVMARRSAKIIK
jgi:hypothetical protein